MIDDALHNHHPSILTRRQRQVLRLQAYGFTHQEIATRLGLSIWTVKNHHKQAVRTLAASLHTIPRERVRTSLACYILGLIDGGWTPQQIARRLKDLSPPPPGAEEVTVAIPADMDAAMASDESDGDLVHAAT